MSIYLNVEKYNHLGYMINIYNFYKDYKTKDEMIEQLILDLEKLKADLIEQQYKKILKKCEANTIK